MPSIAFVDKDVDKEMNKITTNNSSRVIFPEHDFYLSCIKLGLTREDMKHLTYVDIFKMLICLNNTKPKTKGNVRTATQKDIDTLLS